MDIKMFFKDIQENLGKFWTSFYNISVETTGKAKKNQKILGCSSSNETMKSTELCANRQI